MSRKPAVIEIDLGRKRQVRQSEGPQPPDSPTPATSNRVRVLPETRDEITRRWMFDEASTRDLRMALIAGGKPVAREFVESVVRQGVLARLQRRAA